MKITKLTSNQAREIMPTACKIAEDNGLLVLGAIQMPVSAPDAWPSGYDLDREAGANFAGGTVPSDEVYCDSDDDDVVTWLVVRA